MTRNLRLRPLRLPIYEDPPHQYHLIAKVDGDCSNDDRKKASSAVNAVIDAMKKTNTPMDEIISSIVQTFPSHVLKGYNYSANNSPNSLIASSSRFKSKLNLVSASDSDAAATSSSKKPAATPFPPRRHRKTTKGDVSHCDRPHYRALKSSLFLISDGTEVPYTPPSATPSSLTEPMPPPLPPKTASGTSGSASLADAFGEPPAGIDLEFIDEQQPQVVRPLAKRSNSHADVSNEVGKLSSKVESLEKLLRGRFDRLSGTVLTLTATMTGIKEQLDSIDSKVENIQHNYLMTKVTSQACFPLASAAETNAYLEADPKCTALTERYVIRV